MKRSIFISSAQKEFADERQALKHFVHGDALLGRFFEAFMFEDMPASDRRADAVYLDEVRRCDIYIAILGNQYGWEDRDGISPTHREFKEATRLGKPRLVFIKGDAGESHHHKMKALIASTGEQLVRRRFQSTPGLTVSVYASLIQYLEQIGLIRTGPFDATACQKATMEDISEEKISWFLQRAKSSRGYALREGTPMQEALTHLNLLDRGNPSHAAILLFGKAPQRFLAPSEVKCMHFHGTQVQKPIPSYHIYKGTVFDLVDQSVDFVMSKLNRSVGTRKLGPEAPVEYDIPQEVVAEGIVNAIAHRDYTSNASVQAMLFTDRLEIWNPGELRPPLSLDGLTRPHPSIPANPLIAEPLFLVKYIEKAGSGTMDMIERCRDAGLCPPEFRMDMGSFILTIWRKVPAGKVTPEVTPEVRVVQVLKGEMSRRELQAALKLKDDEHFRKAYLIPALESGLIEMTKPDVPRSRIQKYRLPAKGKAQLALLQAKRAK